MALIHYTDADLRTALRPLLAAGPQRLLIALSYLCMLEAERCATGDGRGSVRGWEDAAAACWRASGVVDGGLGAPGHLEVAGSR